MRIGVPIILFVAVAGFHKAISATLQSEESNESPEERDSEYADNSTTLQPDESQYAAAHVEDNALKTTHMALKGGETLTVKKDEENYEESEEIRVLEKEDTDDGETEALADAIGVSPGSDEPVETDSEDDTSQQTTDHSEQFGENVRSDEDVTEEEFNGFYNS